MVKIKLLSPGIVGVEDVRAKVGVLLVVNVTIAVSVLPWGGTREILYLTPFAATGNLTLILLGSVPTTRA